MPSNHLFFYFNDDLKISEHWVVNGTNYGKTSEAWLSNMDRHKKDHADFSQHLWQSRGRKMVGILAFVLYGLC
ncbi:hypothetical protein [Pedobacter sp. UC225_65]|uniref:hypothetical protein n=1 Tax=Pedobacter sp. UC225_65 TaxID=3350173 RepID=UPI00366A7EF9